jgi:hypothetical protein
MIGSPALDISQVSPPPSKDGASQSEGRRKLYGLRFIAGELLGGRQANCGHLPVIREGDSVKIFSKDENNLFYSGLETCGSVWVCPVCALKITYQRANHVAEVLKAFQEATFIEGLAVHKVYALGFLTLTTRHNIAEKCKDVKDRVLKAWRKINKSRRFVELCEKFNVVGDIRALEVKFSSRTGWHPHLHIAYVANCSTGFLQWFGECVIDMWLSEMGEQAGREGQKYLPILNYKGISDYINKWDVADELTKAHTKVNSRGFQESYSPFSMLEYIRKMKHAGDNDNLRLFMWKYKEFAAAFKGAKQLTFSKRLIEIFNFLEIKSDEEITNEIQEGAVCELNIEYELFNKIAQNQLQAEILNIYQFEGIPEIIMLLMEFGVFIEYDPQDNLIKLDRKYHPKIFKNKSIENGRERTNIINSGGRKIYTPCEIKRNLLAQ